MSIRRLRSVMSPVGARCRLCGLDASTDHYTAIEFTVEHVAPGDSLAICNRSRWLCDPCVAAIAKGPS